MKLRILTLFLCLTLTNTQAQNFDNIDQKVRLYPTRYASANQLANQITKDFTNDIDRVRAVYTWLTLNVSYDLQTLYNGDAQINFSYSDQEDLRRKLAAINTHTVNKTLRTKKAICEGYAQTFKKVSELMSIPCMLVGGFSKVDVDDIGTNPAVENHAWNAVKINKKWYLVDATWGAGYTNGNKWMQRQDNFFFLTDPNKFALTHYPSEREWLFTNKSITKKQFYESPIYDKSFFRNNLKLISPLKGELYVKPNENIVFTMETIPKNVTLYYIFKGDKYSEKIEPTCMNGKCTFEIPFVKNRNSELILFANERTALHYKIILKD